MIIERWRIVESHQLRDGDDKYKRPHRLIINEREDGSWLILLFWPTGMERARQRAAYKMWLEIGGYPIYSLIEFYKMDKFEVAY